MSAAYATVPRRFLKLVALAKCDRTMHLIAAMLSDDVFHIHLENQAKNKDRP